MLFSENLNEFPETLPNVVNDAIQDIGRYFSRTDLKILSFTENCIAIPVTLTVELPPNGPVRGIDIRNHEPILILIWINEFPNLAPKVLSDRTDFPKEHLSHLYASPGDNPAALCLVRGNPNEWFAGVRIQDLLGVCEEWFFKAATGFLDTDGNEFDPLRPMGYSGNHIYNYEMVRDVAREAVEFVNGFPAACMFTLFFPYNGDVIFKTLRSVQFIEIEKTLELIATIDRNEIGDRHKALLSVLLWDPTDMTNDNYVIDFPSNYGELKLYFKKHNIDVDHVLRVFGSKNVLGSVVPIVHAIKRSKKLVGFDGEYEFVNFAMKVERENGKIKDNATVKLLSHIEPFSKNLAAKLTEEDRDSNTFFLGAGSLGSKIIMHDARSGKFSMGICDEDIFLQHNKVRHVLFDNKVGQNKALALLAELNDMFITDVSRSFKAYPSKIIDVDIKDLLTYDWLVDTTASLNVQNWLVQSKLIKRPTVARCELANYGKLGLLYIEGEQRNPRIDDLINLAYFRATTYPEIEDWRKADATRDISTLEIGLGCSSTTSVMADDTISIHAAVFSKLLYNEKNRKNIQEKGLIYLSSITDNTFPETSSRYELVEPFECFNCLAGSGWEIRFISGLSAKLLSLCNQFSPYETGGVLLGICNYKTKTIHVFDIIEEPRDSKSSCTGFSRGIDGLPEQVDVLKQITGETIGYVGEWHTHPMNLEQLSGRDKDTISELGEINRKVPIPTFAIIVTPKKILPFVYE
jgi:hypothetical protein